MDQSILGLPNPGGGCRHRLGQDERAMVYQLLGEDAGFLERMRELQVYQIPEEDLGIDRDRMREQWVYQTLEGDTGFWE